MGREQWLSSGGLQWKQSASPLSPEKAPPQVVCNFISTNNNNRHWSVLCTGPGKVYLPSKLLIEKDAI